MVRSTGARADEHTMRLNGDHAVGVGDMAHGKRLDALVTLHPSFGVNAAEASGSHVTNGERPGESGGVSGLMCGGAEHVVENQSAYPPAVDVSWRAFIGSTEVYVGIDRAVRIVV